MCSDQLRKFGKRCSKKSFLLALNDAVCSRIGFGTLRGDEELEVFVLVTDE